MNIFIYDSSFNTIGIADKYESFIWTERYSEAGDFELYAPVSDALINLARYGSYLEIEGSEYLMVVESIEIITDAENGDKIKVTGRSFESVLERRIIWKKISFQNTAIETVIQTLLNDNLINPSNTKRKINGISFAASGIAAMANRKITAEYHGENLYDVIKSICDSFSIGFKLTRSNGTFTFTLFEGSDRSYNQSVNPYVVFSQSFGNLISSDYVRSTAAVKNVAMVLGEPESYVTETVNVPIQQKSTTNYVHLTGTEVGYYDEATSQWVTWNPGPDGANVSGSKVGYRDTGGTWVEWNPGETKQQAATTQSVTRYYAQLTAEVGDSEGLGRREVFVDETNEARTDENEHFMTDSEYSALLNQKGKEALSELVTSAEESFSAELETIRGFKYGTDYFIGDILQVVNEYGIASRVRVTEYIRSDSTSGINFYPTFVTVPTEVN